MLKKRKIKDILISALINQPINPISSQNRLKDKGRVAANLKQEVSIIQSALTGDVELTWIKDLMTANLLAELDWQVGTEGALEKCGVNCKISNDCEHQTRHGPCVIIHKGEFIHQFFFYVVKKSRNKTRKNLERSREE